MASSAQQPKDYGLLGKILSSIFGTSAAAQTTGQAQSAATSSTPANANQSVDVAKILDGKVAQGAQKLNWKTSIVDLLKLLNLDSSFEARTSLASELGYTGDTKDSATMNTWLHKQVMKKLTENGGQLPAGLKN